MRRRRILFAGFVVRTEDSRLPKFVMFGKLVGGAGYMGRRGKSGWGVAVTTLELSVSTPNSTQLHPRTRGNDARRRNKRWNGSW